MEYVHELNKKKADLLGFVDTQVTKSKTRMQDMHRVWMLNLAWVRGLQDYDYDKSSRHYRKSPKADWRVRLISNLLLPIVRKSISKYLQIQPMWEVIAATPDEEDIQIANTSTKLLQDYWQVENMPLKLIQLITWFSSCCSSFLKVGWDPHQGPLKAVDIALIEDDLVSQLVTQAGFSPESSTIDIPDGSPFIDVVPPFNMIIPASSVVFDDSIWCIEQTLRDMDYIVDNFGSRWKDILSESDSKEIFFYPNSYYSQDSHLDRKGIVVRELWLKPGGRKNKKGIHAIVAGGEILAKTQDFPYNHGELPYSHFLEIFDPGSVWGTCIVEQIRPNQAEYNRIRSGIVENINLMSNPKWVAPRGSVRGFNNKPGGVIEYTGPVAPVMSSPKPMPAYVERMLDRIRSDIQDTASSHDVSEAKAEPGIRSGKAVLALQDADDSIMGPALVWFDKALERTGRLLIQTIGQFQREDKTVSIVGDFNQLETLSYSGLDLSGKGDGDYWRVRVKSFGRSAVSRASRESQATALVQLGVLQPATNPVDRDVLTHILGTADILTTFDEHKAARSRQWRELTGMEQGTQVLVTKGENHRVHIEIIDKYITSPSWEQLPPEGKQLVQQHRDQHSQAIVMETIEPQLILQSILGQMGLGPERENDNGGNTSNRSTSSGGDTGGSSGRSGTAGNARTKTRGGIRA